MFKVQRAASKPESRCLSLPTEVAFTQKVQGVPNHIPKMFPFSAQRRI